MKIEHNVFYQDAEAANAYESIDMNAAVITGYEGKRRKLHPQSIESINDQY